MFFDPSTPPIALSGLSPDQEFSRHKALCYLMTNHIPQLLANFHQNLMRGFEDISQKGHFSAKKVCLAMVPRSASQN